jgi:aldehyde:ferredoxin oxidoreductase
MGWDKAGRPLPETLKRLGLEFAVKELEKKV